MNFGIDKACFYTPPYYLNLADLAEARGVDPDKYLIGLGQKEMAVIPPDEGIVTMAASAAAKLLDQEDKSQIRTLLFATESGIDQSKSAGIYVHQLLDLSPNTRVLELKQACYSGTGALLLAMGYLKANPTEKILLITSDIAKYGLNTPGESSQGGGAVAMLLSANPRLLAIEPGSGIFTEDIMDFWRPNYREEALVEGKVSCDQYLKALKAVWSDYETQTARKFSDHQHFIYHIPFPKLAEKAHQKLLQTCQQNRLSNDEVSAELSEALNYSKKIGNCYTGSLYLGLISLLENNTENLSDHRIGFYSYGSGCVAEFFSGLVMPEYQQVLFQTYHQALLTERTRLSMTEYENFYTYTHSLPKDGGAKILPEVTKGPYRLSRVENHKQIYIKSSKNFSKKNNFNHLNMTDVFKISAQAPGKLIISGEHAVVAGAPAIAIAIDRYAKTTVSQIKTEVSSVLFNLLNINHRTKISRTSLKSLASKIRRGYQSFLNGDKSIKDVLEKPFELLHYTAQNILEKLGIPEESNSFEIHTESDIPISCGLGSSAASIVSTNYALSQFLQQFNQNQNQNQNHPLSINAAGACSNYSNYSNYFEWCLDAENIQHGKSSGIDIQMSLNGGMARYQKGVFTPLKTKQYPWEILIINTGPSGSSTGECVAHTQKIFQTEPDLLNKITQITNQIQTAIETADLALFISNIQKNHEILTQLGVVPPSIQKLIKNLEELGGAGKICGSGALFGTQAGVILTAGISYQQLQALNLGYPIEKLRISTTGVETIDRQPCLSTTKTKTKTNTPSEF